MIFCLPPIPKRKDNSTNKCRCDNIMLFFFPFSFSFFFIFNDCCLAELNLSVSVDPLGLFVIYLNDFSLQSSGVDASASGC